MSKKKMTRLTMEALEVLSFSQRRLIEIDNEQGIAVVELQEWRAVPGYEASHEVSSQGRVRSRGRWVANRWYPGRELTQVVTRSGHLDVQLCRDGSAQHFAVHRLVLMAFVGPCPEGLVCCHNDGDAANNHISNLRWDTIESNAQDSVRHGTHPHASKVECIAGHPLTPENCYIPKPGERSCRACRRRRSRELRAKRRAEAVSA